MRKRKVKQLGSGTIASNPGEFQLSQKLLSRLRPDLYGIRGYFKNKRDYKKSGLTIIDAIEQQLKFGDCRAAIVINTSPCLIAAYTDELDCVAILHLPKKLAKKYRFKQTDRLLTVNSYNNKDHPDLKQGPNATGRYTGFNPIIVNLVCEDTEAIKLRESTITSQEWLRTMNLGREYRNHYPAINRPAIPSFY